MTAEHDTFPGPVFANDCQTLADTFQSSSALLGPAVELAASEIIRCFARGGKLLICGNGGSAADSQHLAAEFMSSFMLGLDRRALPAIALTTDTSILTAFGNDFTFDGVFARQVEGLGRSEDVLLCISTSGRSPNVLHAAQAARHIGMTVIALTGGAGGQLAGLADVVVAVPSSDTQVIQTVHLAVEHFFCAAAEHAIRKGAIAP